MTADTAVDSRVVDADGHLCEPPRLWEGRYVVDAAGYHSVIVNGRTLLRDGTDTGNRPGTVLRSVSEDSLR